MTKSAVCSIQVWAASIIVGSLPLVSVSAQEGFTSLFNGKDLTGWVPVGTPKAFTVRDGAILSTGATPYPSWLRTEKTYENFVLRFEYRTEGWYEGGVVLHAPAEGPASTLGLKIHLRHDQHEYGTRSPGAIYDVAAPRRLVNLPSGQWNRCEVECDWPVLRVTLNGTVIHDLNMDANEVLKYRLRRGYFGLQNIGCRASFRNLQIRPLPDREHWTDVLAGGLAGLRTTGKADWQIQGDTLIGQGPTGEAFTTQSFAGPFELQVWVKTALDGNGGVFFNCHPTGLEVQCFSVADSTNPTGSLYGLVPARRVVSRDEEWYLLQIFSEGSKAMVFVNGVKVCATDKLRPPYQGGLGFQQHTPGATISYRAPRVKTWPAGFLK